MQPQGLYNLAVDDSGMGVSPARVGLREDRTGIPVCVLFLRDIPREQRFELFSASDVETRIYESLNPSDQEAWRMLLPFFEAEGSKLHVVAHPLFSELKKPRASLLKQMIGADKGLLRRTGLHVLKSYRDRADIAFVPQASTLLTAEDHRLFYQAVMDLLVEDPHFLFLVDFPASFSAEDAKEWARNVVCPDIAAYHPWIVKDNQVYAPSAFVAAAIQKNDEQFGIHHLPSNHPLKGGFKPLIKQSPGQVSELLKHRLNTFHNFNVDTRLWGGYTLADRTDENGRFICTRRTMLAIREMIHQICEPFVLEPVSAGLEKTIDVELQSAFQPLRQIFDPEAKNAFETNVEIYSQRGQEVITIDVTCKIPYVLGEMKFSLGLTG